MNNLNERLVADIAVNFPKMFRQLPKSRKNKKPVRIKYKGEFVMFANGKTVWAGMGPAKNAFNLHFDRFMNWQIRYERGGYVHWETGVTMTAQELTEYHAAVKHATLKDIEFVEVDKL